VTEAAASARRALLERAAADAGERWARARIADLRAERRAPAGGWPGTLSEARALSRAIRPFAEGSHESLTAEELELVARKAYACARSAWQAHAEPEDPEGCDVPSSMEVRE
jgi:hypothetical protein